MSKRNSEQANLFKRSIFWLMILVAVAGVTYSYEKSLFQGSFEVLTASTSTRELPIYCVETDKPQVALSFDAAWGNGKMRKKSLTCLDERFFIFNIFFYCI